MELKCINCEAYPSDSSLCAYWKYTHHCPKENISITIIEELRQASNE